MFQFYTALFNTTWKIAHLIVVDAIAQEEQEVKVEEDGDKSAHEYDCVGGLRLGELLGQLDEVGGNGPVDGHAGEQEARQVRGRVEQERADAAYVDALLAHNESKEGDEHNVAEAGEQGAQVDERQARQVDERGVLAHVRPREHEKAEQVAEQADDEQDERRPFEKRAVDVVNVRVLSTGGISTRRTLREKENKLVWVHMYIHVRLRSLHRVYRVETGGGGQQVVVDAANGRQRGNVKSVELIWTLVLKDVVHRLDCERRVAAF